MKKKNFVSILTIPLVFCLAVQVQAAPPVLDQEAPVADPFPFTFALDSGQVLYQSLTVGLSGRLAEIRLPIGCESGEVTLEIFAADSDGLPIEGAHPLLTRDFDAELFPVVVSVDFQPLPLGGRVGVSPGESIVMVLSNLTGSCGIAAGVPDDGYSGGTGHFDDPNDLFAPAPLISLPGDPDDLPFQTFIRETGRGAP